MKWLILILFLLSCGHEDKINPNKSAKKHDMDKWYKIEKKRELYLKLTDEVRDEHGFVDNCDSLLWAGLSIVGGVAVNLEAAEIDGLWFRKPSAAGFPGRSKERLRRPGSSPDSLRRKASNPEAPPHPAAVDGRATACGFPDRFRGFSPNNPC